MSHSPSFRRSRVRAIGLLAAVTSVALTLALAVPAVASLQLRQPDPSVPATFVGKGGYSSDGLGQNGTGGTVQAVVPAGSTVEHAFLYGTYFVDNPDASARTIRVDSTDVLTEKVSDVGGLSTTFADVTTLVRAKIGSGGAAPFDFAINNDPSVLDGVALVVIFSNPSFPQTTIAVLDGSASQTGDQATFNFAQPLDKTVPNFVATLALGSGFSFQGVSGSACGGGQFSVVEINTQLLSNCAGNYDDGLGNDGALITVGGVGDSTNNPTPPNNPATDDELYDLDPFLSQGDTSLVITSSNPSQDDNLFLAVIETSAAAAVTTEDCDNGVDDDQDGKADGADPDCYTIMLQHQGSATNTVGDPHTVEADVRDVAANGPASGDVLFTVTGANAASGTDALSAGKATFTYTGLNPGTDDIQACYDLDDDGTCDPDEPKATVQKTYVPGNGGTNTDYMTGRSKLYNGRNQIQGLGPNRKDLDMLFAGSDEKRFKPKPFFLPCDAAAGNVNFMMSWFTRRTPHSGKFVATGIDSASCSDSPSYNPGGGVSFDTWTGVLDGTYNGQAGHTAELTVIDNGEPGFRRDRGHIKIKAPDGTTVFEAATTKNIPSQAAGFGNHEAVEGPLPAA
jgi:hypothetical protein